MNIPSLIGGGVAAGAIIVTGQHYFTTRTWKNTHPLVAEALRIASSDPVVSESLGETLAQASDVSGVLDYSRAWSNINFQVEGDKAKATVVVLAENSLETAYPLVSPPKELSYYESLLAVFGKLSPNATQELYWKIITLNVKFDEATTHPIINETLKSHEELHSEEPLVTPLDTEGPEGSEGRESRKRKNFQKVQRRWMYIAGSGFFLGTVWWVTRKFFVRRPVGRSIFLHTALDIMKTDSFVRSELGVPLRYLQNLKGHLNNNMTKGQAQGTIYGPLGFAKFKALGRYEAKSKTWKFDELVVIKDQERHSLI